LRKVLITGGAGFIGSHLARVLRRRGVAVRVLDNLSTGTPENLSPEVELIAGDILDAELVRKAMEGVDAVFHLAAIASVAESARDWRRAHAVNQGGALEVFQAAAESARRPRVVFASSAAVYGEPERLPLDERSPTTPLSQYGADKLSCEYHARVIAEASRLAWIGFRIFNVYGPGQDPSSPYSGVITTFLQRLGSGEDLCVFGGGHQQRDFVHVDDVVDCFLWAMACGETGFEIVNLCTGRATTITRLAKLMLRLRNSTQAIVNAAPRAGDVQNSVGDNAKLSRLGGPVPKTSLRQGLKLMLDAADPSLKQQ